MKIHLHSVFSWNNSKQKTGKLMTKARKTLTVCCSLLMALLLAGLSVMISQPVIAAAASKAADFTAYSLPGETGPAVINSSAGTIGVTVPSGTNVTVLIAKFTTSAGVSSVKVGGASQVSGTTPNNFTNPVTYAITAQDGTTKKNWAVTVTAAQTTGGSTNGAADSNDGGQVAASSSSSSSIKSQAIASDAQTDYTLTVNVSGSGTVNQTLLSGSSSAASTYSYFSNVQVAAVPAAGWTFTGWGGCLDGFTNPNSVAMSTDLTVTAIFKIVPSVTTVSSSVTANDVTLNGTLVNMGGSPAQTSAQVAFEWGLGTDYGSITTLQTKSATGAFIANITGIAAGTTYHFRAMATADGTGYGADQTFTTPPASANPNGWWNAAWNYRTSVNINGTGTALTSYQITVPVSYNSNMRTDFGDVRFVAADNATVLNYWMTSETAGASATFWVLVPSIAASGQTKIYMYYANSMAVTTSNIHTAFIFGDDFSDPVYTYDHIVAWDGGASSQGIVMENGTPVYEFSGDNTNTTTADRSEPIAQISNTGGGLTAFPGNYVAEADVESFIQNGSIFFNARYQDVNWKYEQVLDFEYNQVVENKVVNTVWTNLGITPLGYQTALNTWYGFKAVVLANGTTTTLETFVNGVQIGGAVSDSDLPYPTYPGLGFLTFSVDGPFHSGFQDIRVRQYAAVEPQVAMGTSTQNNVTQIVFTSAAQTIAAGAISNQITIQSENSNNEPFNCTGNTTVNLTSTSGTGVFSLSNTTWANITAVTIPVGSDNAAFYYKDTASGTPTITIASTGLTGGTQQEKITSNPTDATLSNLTISVGTLTPAFAAGTIGYTDNVANSVTSLTVTPTANQAGATITVNGTGVASGAASGAINLSVGSNSIAIIVTAPDGTTKDTYTITVTVALSNAAQITAYSLPGQTGTATINSTAGTIGVTVPAGTNVTAPVATFTTSVGVSSVKVGSVSQVSGTTPNNFTNPLVYAVTAQDGVTVQNWTVTVTVQSATTEIIKSVATGADDGFTGSWGFYSTLTWLQVGNPGSPYNDWFRFTGITIPKGATIVHAYLVIGESSWAVGTNLKISAEKTANPTAPTSNANEASKVRTTASVVWNSGSSDGAYHNSPDIASVIQELVNNFSYTTGSAIQILVDNNGSTSPNQALLNSFESGTPPKLDIVYSQGALSNAAQITAYSLPGQTGTATINSTAGTIGVTVPAGTNVTALVATFTTSAGVSSVKVGSVSQVSGTTPNNFTNPLVYAVTAQDGVTVQNWTVTVTVALSNAAQITAYSLPGQTGTATINSTAGTIGVTVPAGTNVTAPVATFTTSVGVSSVKVGSVSQVSGTTPNNFTNPLVYAVTAQDGVTVQNWTVTVTVQSATTEIIKSVATGADDGFTGSWGFYSTLTWLQAGNPGSPYNDWFRFTGITIPKGATIVHAYLVIGESSWAVGTNLKISAEKTANPTAPTSNANEASKVRTTASVVWNSGSSDGAYHNSPDIASVIQELVNNFSYTTGSAIQILVDNNGSTSPNQALLNSFESGTLPQLEIFYTMP